MVRTLEPELDRLRHIVAFAEETPGVIAYASLESAQDRALPRVAPDDVGALLYTSGTTGLPKGALLTHAGMLTVGWQTTERLGIGADDRWTSIIPLFHCAGCIMNILGCLQRGACYVGVPSFDPVGVFEVIESERCTALSGVPTSYLAMLDHPERGRFDLSRLRTGTCGGADANPDILRRCAKELPMPYLVQVYGQTESCTLITCPRFDDEDRFDTAGPVLEGCDLRITAPGTGKRLDAGAIGQVEARGPIVMKGYYANPEATAETIDAEGWLKTGDLGYLTPSGSLRLAGGRLRDMIIRGGENIYPAEIENWLITHPAVRQVAVFGVEDAYYGEVVAAAVALSHRVTPEELAAHCHGRLARFKTPVQWYEVDAFPMTANGKVRKRELREAAREERLERLGYL